MGNVMPIDPDTVYSEGAVSLALDLPLATLHRERRDGRLRYTRKGNRVLILGRWLLDWMNRDDSRKEVVSCGR